MASSSRLLRACCVCCNTGDSQAHSRQRPSGGSVSSTRLPSRGANSNDERVERGRTQDASACPCAQSEANPDEHAAPQGQPNADVIPEAAGPQGLGEIDIFRGLDGPAGRQVPEIPMLRPGHRLRSAGAASRATAYAEIPMLRPAQPPLHRLRSAGASAASESTESNAAASRPPKRPNPVKKRSGDEVQAKFLRVNQISGRESNVDIEGLLTVAEIRAAVAAEVGMPKNITQLINPRDGNRMLDDGEKVEDLELKDGTYLNVIAARRECRNRYDAEKRLRKEMLDIRNSSEFRVTVEDIDVFVWNVQIPGPLSTPYEPIEIDCQITFPSDYPFKPPDVILTTPVYHCNVDEKGLVCMDILHDQWSPALTADKVLHSFVSLLSDPNPHDAINAEAAALYLSDKLQYDARVHQCVSERLLEQRNSDVLERRDQ